MDFRVKIHEDGTGKGSCPVIGLWF